MNLVGCLNDLLIGFKEALDKGLVSSMVIAIKNNWTKHNGMDQNTDTVCFKIFLA